MDNSITQTSTQKVRTYKATNKRALRETKQTSTGSGIVLLADRSGSMAGDKMHYLRKALTDVWRPGLQAIAFDSDLWEIEHQDIPTLDATGTTQMWEALKEAWSRNPRHIVLMTDGEPDDRKQDILADVMVHREIKIDTVGIGNQGGHGYDPDFLKEIARITGGKYHSVHEPIMLPTVLRGLLEEGSGQREGVISL